MLLSEIANQSDFWATRVWSFTPESWGALGFPKEGTARRWVQDGRNRFVVCFVSHNPADHISSDDQGRVLGVYELTPELVELESEQVLAPFHLIDQAMRREDGGLRWPFGLRSVRAWRFKTVVKTREALPETRRLGQSVSTDLIPLPAGDFALLSQSSYALEQVPVYPATALPTLQRVAEPVELPTEVYLFACGNEKMISRLPHWKAGLKLVKIGCASDVAVRLADFNNHPLARIFGLKLAKVAARHVGAGNAFAEERRLLEIARQIGIPASDESSEFFLMNDFNLKKIQLEVSPIVRVA